MQKNWTYFGALLALLFNASWLAAQNVGITPNGAAPDSSALLDIASPDKGLLIPRMDSTARKNIMNPAEGLMVFDSTYNSFYVYDGMAWTAFWKGNDDLGNHIASQNLQMNNNWLNNDGAANKGLYVDTSGQVGVGAKPATTFQVAMGKVPEVNVSNTSSSDFLTLDVCQSFTITKTGELQSIELFGRTGQAVTYSLYEGSGTGGTRLAGPLNQADAQNPYLFSGVNLTQGQVYTIEVLNPSGAIFDINFDGDAYFGGQACIDPLADYWFKVNLLAEKPGFRISDTQIQINDLKLPTADGTASQLLSTDGAGNLSWINSANSDNQDLSLSGNTLSVTNDGTPVNLSPFMDNTDAQNLSLSGNTLSLTNDGTTVDLSAYLDNTDAQDLSRSGNTLSLTNDGTTVDLSPLLDNTDAQDLSLSGNTLSVTNDGTTVDLSPYLDNTDAQDLSLSGRILSLSNDASSVDLTGYLGADDLGNHTATQNLQLNDNWINNDGDANEGLNIDNSGQVGVNTVPAASFHVNMGGPTTSNVLTIPHNSTTFSTAVEWQSFTAPGSGDLNSITLFLTNTGGSTTYRINAGEGTSGTMLYENTISCVAGNNTFNVSGVTLVKNQVYTIVFFPPFAQPHTFYYDNTNPYSSGVSRANAGWDLAITVNMTLENLGLRVENSGVTFNQYTLPLTDGTGNQILTTDGFGNVSWAAIPGSSADNMGNHTAAQNLQLNNQWLSNDGDNEGIAIDNSGKIGLGREVGTVGAAKFEYYGPSESLAGPHMQVVTSGSNYPVFQQLNWRHDNMAMIFDAYYDGGWRSSGGSGSFSIYKTEGHLRRFISSAQTQGSTITWSTGTVLDTLGRFGIGRDPVTNKLEVQGTASKATAGSWLANSDARLKKNIKPLTSERMLDKLLALQGVSYEWDDDKTGSQRPEGIQYGFTAQNIQEAFPTLVTTDNQAYLQTPYGTYDAMTVEALRALNEKIIQLEKDKTKLRTQLKNLRSKNQALKTHTAALDELKTAFAELKSKLGKNK